MDLSDNALLQAVEEMETFLFTARFGRYEVRVKKPEYVHILDTWQDKKVVCLMDRLLKSDLQEIEQALRLVESGLSVNQSYYIGAEAKIKSPVPLVDLQGIKLDRHAWLKWMSVWGELKKEFPQRNEYTMQQAHKDILRRNRVFLLRNMRVCDTLVGWLSSQRVLSMCMAEELHSPRYATNTAKVGHLLDLLPMRGPNAFNLFVEGLVMTDQWYVVEKLLSE